MEGSKKSVKWNKKDVYAVVAVFVLNMLVLFGLFIAMVYLDYRLSDNTQSFIEILRGIRMPLRVIVMILITLGVMWLYFYYEAKEFLRHASNMEMIFLILELSLIISFVFGRYIDLYLRPLALASMLVLYLKNRRSAFFTTVVFCLLLLLMDSSFITNSTLALEDYFSLIICYSSGMMSIFLLENEYSRIKLIFKSTILSVPAVLCLCVKYLDGGGASFLTDLACAVASGPLSAGLFIVLLPIFEGMFRKISCFKLAELTSHRAPLIKEMINKAPGTFNHSIVVSNIAEACAIAIEEDSLLARACAYYHDIGKLRRPEYFSENQINGVNPHDDLTPELSTSIIKYHTVDGYQQLLKHRFPVEIANCCLEHHGTMPIIYFYNKAKQLTEGDVDIKQYSYAGPKPRTKINAIIMIADGCEAAVRVSKDRSFENVTEIVKKIINDRMKLGQFDDCEITLKELKIISETVINNLTGVYHKRVEYPDLDFERK